MTPTPRIAFVHDWLPVYGGAERTLEAALELFPGAPVYTLIYQPEQFEQTGIARHPVITSMIQSLPKGRERYRSYLPVMPFAVEQFDLRQFDLVVSSSYAVAKGAITRPDQLHISYTYTPPRYAWDLQSQYLEELGMSRGAKSLLIRIVLHYLRLWDVASANRVDKFVAISRYVAQRIRKTYRRDAEVIYPPVDVSRFPLSAHRQQFYLTVSRLVPYKRTVMIVQAFNKLRLPLVVIGDGPELPRLKRIAGKNVSLLGYQPDEVVTDYLARCKAFVYAADEDFGIVPVEAQATGAPVIAYGRGGVRETVIEGETGLFFSDQTAVSLEDAVRKFEFSSGTFVPARARRNAERFSRQRFQREFAALIESETTTSQLSPLGNGWSKVAESAVGSYNS